MVKSLVPVGMRFPRLFDDFREDFDGLVSRFFHDEDADAGTLAWYTPRMNLAEADDHYELTVDLPGVKPEEVEVEYRNGELWISGERRQETEAKEKTFHRIERRYGSFRRVIRLGDVDPDRIQAKHHDGVLHIELPKAESACAKRIEVKT